MAILALVVFFFFLFISTSGQATSSSGETVWAAVAFLVAGEHTPTLGPWPSSSSSSSILTPAGAQQMLRQGEVFRTRYILNQDDDGGGSSSNVVPRAQIRNISRDTLDNAQLSILAAGKDNHVVAGAMAFMQGLYPPANAVANSTISLDAVAQDVVKYPLGGYQYPAIRTAGILDEESIYVQGHIGCTSWENFTDVYIKPENMRTYNALTSEFSQLILAHDVLTGIIPFEAVNFWNAYDVWTAVDYQYRHNQTVHDGLAEWNATLRDEFKGYALLEQLARNSDGSISNDPLSGEKERLIPGRTLAKQILTALRIRLAAAADNEDDEQLLTLMFGSIEPVMSFAALANLTGTNSSSSSSQFLPETGSALVFELFSTVESSSTTKISNTEDLFIRAYFRPGTNNASDEFEPRRLFSSNKDDNSMPFAEFAQRMAAIEYDVWTWCDACRANTPFCRGRRDAGILTDGHQGDDSFASHMRGRVSAVAAGVIGAMVTFAVMGLGMVAAVVGGGVRVSRAVPGERGKRHAEKESPDVELQDGSRGGGGGGGGSSVSSVASPGIGHEIGVVPASASTSGSVSGIQILERGMAAKVKVKEGESGLWFKGDDDGDDRDDHVLQEMGMKPTKPHDVV